MFQLIKVDVSLRAVDEPFDPRWRSHLAMAFGLMTIASFCVCLAAIGSGQSLAIVMAASLWLLGSIAGVAVCSSRWLFLPASARQFLRDTRSEYDDLVRRTEAHNRAWCLAERSGGQPSMGENDPYRRSFMKLDAAVEAYAERYRAAVAADAMKVRSGKLLRKLRVRSQDLRELEARLADLGQDALPEAHAQVAELREAIERDRQSLKRPLALPEAKVVSR